MYIFIQTGKFKRFSSCFSIHPSFLPSLAPCSPSLKEEKIRKGEYKKERKERGKEMIKERRKVMRERERERERERANTKSGKSSMSS